MRGKRERCLSLYLRLSLFPIYFNLSEVLIWNSNAPITDKKYLSKLKYFLSVIGRILYKISRVYKICVCFVRQYIYKYKMSGLTEYSRWPFIQFPRDLSTLYIISTKCPPCILCTIGRLTTRFVRPPKNFMSALSGRKKRSHSYFWMECLTWLIQQKEFN